MSESTDTRTLAQILERVVAGQGFPAYEGLDAPAHESLRVAAAELAEAALATGGDGTLDRFRAAAAEHLADPAHRAQFYDGVSARRLDRDPYFDTQLAEAEARFAGAGAVHLELGTWTAWPTERAEALAEKDDLAEVIRLDFEATYELDVVADARRLPFRDASIDRISADSVLEHIAQSELVLDECFRVLKPGGLLKVITPFAFNLHGYPDDYLRYTPSWYTERCSEAGFETIAADVEATRGLYYTVHNALKSAQVDPEHPDAPALRTLHLVLLELLGTLVPLDDGFHNGARNWFTAVQCFALKGGGYHAPHRARDWSRPFVDRGLDLLSVPGSDVGLRRDGDRLVDDVDGWRYPIVDGIPRFTQPRRLRRAGGLLRRG